MKCHLHKFTDKGTYIIYAKAKDEYGAESDWESLQVIIPKASQKNFILFDLINNYFEFLGESHCCGQDDVKIMELIGMRVFDPYDLTNYPGFISLINLWITDVNPGYMRV